MAATDYAPYHGVVLIGKETTWGTPVSATKDVGLVQDCTVRESNAEITGYAVGSRAMQYLYAGKYEASGSIKVQYQHARLFEYLFGAVAHDATSTPDIQHTFTEADALPSFTLEDSWNNATNDIAHTYAGCLATGGELTLGVDGVLEASVDFVAKTVAATTTSTGATVSTLETLPSYLASSVKWGTAAAEVTQGTLTNLTLSIANGSIRHDAIGSRLPGVIFPSNRKYTGKFTARMRDDVDYQTMLGGTAPTANATPAVQSLIFDLSNGIALASGRREVYINLRNCIVTSVGTPNKIGGFTEQDFAFTSKTLTSCYTYDNIVSGSW